MTTKTSSGLVVLLLLGALATGASAQQATAAPLDQQLQTIRSLRAKGELDQALTLAGRLVEGHPESLEAHVAYQDLRLARGEERGLAGHYKKRASRKGATADDLYLHARLLDGHKATAAFKKVLRVDPEHFWALCGLGTEYTEQGKASAARKYLERARKVDPKSAIPVNALGWLAERTGDLGGAEEFYTDAMVLDSAFALPRINMGILLVGQRRFSEAVQVLEEARTLAPADPMPLMGLGMVRAGTGDLVGALEHYEDAVALETNTVASLNLLGVAYLGLGQYELAGKAFGMALRKQPDSVTTILNLAYQNLMESEPDRALVWVKNALRVEPECPEAHYFEGLCYEYTGKQKSAEKAYQRAAALDKRNPDYPRALGALYSNLGRWKEAIRAYDHAADLSDRSTQSLLDLAFACVGGGEARAAVRIFEEVLKKEPDNLTAWMNLGLVLSEKLGDRAGAIRAYKQYLERGGADPRVSKWLEDLRKR
jgi:tetratricopeptide (TPR) repeat protein